MSKLVIVESPAKAKTIRKYLGSGFEVMASMGHIRDLPASQMGIDIKQNYRPQYINIAGKGTLIKNLKAAAAEADEIFLATDPDREGEAISWHLAHILKLDTEEENRVTFGEITQKGIKEGMASPRKIDKDLFDAQQARRVLDRLVGYKISPFLWKKIRRGLSAGRVQSVALKLIVDREKQIEAFVAEEYWNIDAQFSTPGSNKKFDARLHGTADGKKLKIENEKAANEILAALEDSQYTIAKVSKANRKRQPAPPFITSTLQQEASRRFGFTALRTMRAAQSLYEGVDIAGQGVTGLITYMRTDSLRVSDEAVAGAKSFISEKYGDKYVYDKKRTYKTKRTANTQDAHEAIRPTDPTLTPEEVEKSIKGDEAKLYRIIWSRFIASQMADAELETVNTDIVANAYMFKANGFTMLFDGFTVLYEEATDEKEKKETALPPLEVGMILKLRDLRSEQKFTQPPGRYTEATLIKELEENGIGRPSTYAPIITTVVDRGYVERENKKLAPTSLGVIVNDVMAEQFANIVDVNFSADMELKLDKVEEGKEEWLKVIDNFYQDFEKTLQKAEESMEGQRLKVPEEETDEICEVCGRKMVIKTGKFGKFLACPGFPECKNTKPIVKDTGGVCPKCGGRMLLKKSKKGRVYYACENNPTCDFLTWDEPLKEKCPTCGSTLYKKAGKAARIYCAKEGCEYEHPYKREKEQEQGKTEE